MGNNINNAIMYFKAKEVKGEITLVIKGKENKYKEFNKFLIKKELNELIDAGLSLSAASSYLAKKKNLNKSEIYNLH